MYIEVFLRRERRKKKEFAAQTSQLWNYTEGVRHEGVRSNGQWGLGNKGGC
jgi:hypothetical protein